MEKPQFTIRWVMLAFRSEGNDNRTDGRTRWTELNSCAGMRLSFVAAPNRSPFARLAGRACTIHRHAIRSGNVCTEAGAARVTVAARDGIYLRGARSERDGGKRTSAIQCLRTLRSRRRAQWLSATWGPAADAHSQSVVTPAACSRWRSLVNRTRTLTDDRPVSVEISGEV